VLQLERASATVPIHANNIQEDNLRLILKRKLAGESVKLRPIDYFVAIVTRLLPRRAQPHVLIAPIPRISLG
jgi:hypothetical protein